MNQMVSKGNYLLIDKNKKKHKAVNRKKINRIKSIR
jgi:hypothetical protein